MTLATLSGLYESSRRINRLLNHPHLDQALKAVLDDPKKLSDLRTALNDLDVHSRDLGASGLSWDSHS